MPFHTALFPPVKTTPSGVTPSSLPRQVSGPLHSDVATCCRYMGSIFFHAGETGNAILQQHRELVICERMLGNDHPDTIHWYAPRGPTAMCG